MLGIIASLSIVLIFAVSCVVYWLVSIRKIESIRCGRRKFLKAGLRRLREALRHNLENCHWFWWYDMLRRMAILAIFAPVTATNSYPQWWVKHLTGQIFIVASLIFHMRNWPYDPVYRSHPPSTAKVPADMTLSRRIWRYFTTDARPWPTGENLPGRWWEKLKYVFANFPLANVVETIILFELMAICQLATTSAEGGVPNEDSSRLVLLESMVRATVFIGSLYFVGLVLWTIVSAILEHRQPGYNPIEGEVNPDTDQEIDEKF